MIRRGPFRKLPGKSFCELAVSSTALEDLCMCPFASLSMMNFSASFSGEMWYTVALSGTTRFPSGGHIFFVVALNDLLNW